MPGSGLTAQPEVVKDIHPGACISAGKNVFRMSFERNNLAYIVRKTENKRRTAAYIAQCPAAPLYVRNRRRTKEITELLNNETSQPISPCRTGRCLQDIRQHRHPVKAAHGSHQRLGISMTSRCASLSDGFARPIEAYFQKLSECDGQKLASSCTPNRTNHAAQAHTDTFRRKTVKDVKYIFNTIRWQ